nr:PREDICTED: olfactory receptor 10AG1-like [Apteryx mantelli mantelli]
MPQRKVLENHTAGSGFVLLGFSDHHNLQGLHFTVFLIIYLVILVGNSLIMLITVVDSSLHSPMYFFLRNLSFLEICYTSVTLPKMLVGFLKDDGRISFLGCAAQLYFLVFLGSTVCLLLAAMAYDRYVAICDPLHYTSIMNGGFCVRLVAGLWMAVAPVQVGQTYQVFTLPFCASHDIHHFFCDVRPLLELACADTFWNQVTLHSIILVVAVLPFFLIVMSYTNIIRTILKMPSVLGRLQVGQTYQVFTLPFCASHDIHHFFCDVRPLLELACADTFWNQVTLHSIILVVAVLPFFLIVMSYTNIIRTILKMPSVLGRRKAFSTCSSHLVVVTLFYGSATVVYLKHQSRDSADTDKYLALFYTVVTPMFNPLIYSLRNKEVRIALKRFLWKK